MKVNLACSCLQLWGSKCTQFNVGSSTRVVSVKLISCGSNGWYVPQYGSESMLINGRDECKALGNSNRFCNAKERVRNDTSDDGIHVSRKH